MERRAIKGKKIRKSPLELLQRGGRGTYQQRTKRKQMHFVNILLFQARFFHYLQPIFAVSKPQLNRRHNYRSSDFNRNPRHLAHPKQSSWTHLTHGCYHGLFIMLSYNIFRIHLKEYVRQTPRKLATACTLVQHKLTAKLRGLTLWEVRIPSR